jgi:hypothetical protein
VPIEAHHHYLFGSEPSQRESGMVRFTGSLMVHASMNSDEEQKGNAKLEHDAHPKRHRLFLAIIGAPFTAVLTGAYLVDRVAKQSEPNQEFHHFAISGAHPSSLKSIDGNTSCDIGSVKHGQPPMCGRSVSPDEAALEREFNLIRLPGLEVRASYNVAPTQKVPMICQA